MNTDNNHIDEKLLLEDERIERYLKGKMTSDEEQEFMQDLQDNPELKTKAVSMARLVKGLKEVGVSRDQEIIDEMFSADEKAIKATAQNAVGKRAKVVPMHSVAKWLSMAASIMLIVWAGFGYNDYRKTTNLGNKFGGVFESSHLTRGNDTSKAEAKLTDLYKNIKEKKDLDNTIHELELCWELSRQETYNDYTDLAPEIGWNLAIGYLKDNDKKKAKAVLGQLTDIAPSDTAIGGKARELLNKVKEL